MLLSPSDGDKKPLLPIGIHLPPLAYFGHLRPTTTIITIMTTTIITIMTTTIITVMTTTIITIMTTTITDLRFVKKFTQPDISAKNFAY